MSLATRLNVLPVQVTADHSIHERYGSQRVFIAVKKLAAFLDLLNLGLKLDVLNVDTMSQTDTTE